MPKPTPEEMREMSKVLNIELCDDSEDGPEVHLVVLRKECGQCGEPARFVSVAPDIHQFLCYACACGEWGREWADAALKMEETIDREEARTGKMWRP